MNRSKAVIKITPSDEGYRMAFSGLANPELCHKIATKLTDILNRRYGNSGEDK